MTAIVAVGLGFGDEGKGSIVDWLVRERNASTVVRFNGGAQAAHHVVTDDGRHHTFAQFGAGSFSGAGTHLSRRMLVNPLALHKEGRVLFGLVDFDPLDRLTIDARAPVTTPYHIALNRLRELARGECPHGSCGMGIGETASDESKWPDRVVRAGDFGSSRVLTEKLELTRRRAWIQAGALEGLPNSELVLKCLGRLKRDSVLESDLLHACHDLRRNVRPAGHLVSLLAAGNVVFEGAQGVLLDEDYGFDPYTTWSRCTAANALEDIDEVGGGEVERWGVTRAFATRHGPGPFPSEGPVFRSNLLVGEHNTAGRWQGAFRVGPLDLVLLRYALEVSPCDQLAVTCLDRLGDYGSVPVCTAWRWTKGPAWSPNQYERLPVLERADNDGRRSLTEFAFDCRPVVVQASAAIFSEWVAAHLDVPVGVESRGPTAEAKHPMVLLAG